MSILAKDLNQIAKAAGVRKSARRTDVAEAFGRGEFTAETMDAFLVNASAPQFAVMPLGARAHAGPIPRCARTPRARGKNIAKKKNPISQQETSAIEPPLSAQKAIRFSICQQRAQVEQSFAPPGLHRANHRSRWRLPDAFNRRGRARHHRCIGEPHGEPTPPCICRQGAQSLRYGIIPPRRVAKHPRWAQ